MVALVFAASTLFGTGLYAASDAGGTPMYDEGAYTEYVEKTMGKLDKLYLQFCDKCTTKPAEAAKAKAEYYKIVRDLLQYMNGRFDKLDPKKGAALSPTETLVSIHVMTMLVDMLTETQMKEGTHPLD
jgi:hypothetical protein